MKFSIPEISWHNRDPVLSADFQPKANVNDPLRLATGGTDSHVLIWYVSTCESGSVNLEVAADLTRHQKAVNVVRWSPDGQLLASGDDESIIFIWKQKAEEASPALEQGEEQYKESWVIHKTLRGHMEDVLDISWSLDCKQLASGSVDNKLLLWDVGRGRYSSILTDHKGFVQGVSWDPLGQYIASASTDRTFRTFEVATKKVASRSSKASLPFPSGHPLHNIRVRLYHDDTLQTFYRRLHFSPDGLLIAVPAGRVEAEQGKADVKPINSVYIYTRYSLKVPACILPCGDPALVTRWSSRRYKLRPDGPRAAFPTQTRMVLAVGTKRSVLIYDTQQTTPIAIISNIHYTRLTDLTWSPDGNKLIASSTDGFCSIITFVNDELGEVLPDEELTTKNSSEPMDVQTEECNDTLKEKKEESKTSLKDPFIKFKTPTEKSATQAAQSQIKTPVKIDLLEEVAMPSWSDNSCNEIIKPKDCVPMDTSDVMVIEDSEDIKLVYDETEGTRLGTEKSLQSPPTQTNQSATKSDQSSTQTKQSPLKSKPSPPKSKQSPPKSKQSPTKPKQPPTKSKQSPTQLKLDSKLSPPAKAGNPFLSQAKVTDVKEPMAVNTLPNQKTPRRVTFVTLSSPKNTKKKC